jgi:hypothetical protein
MNDINDVNDEVEIVAAQDGLAVVGRGQAVELFLRRLGFYELSESFAMNQVAAFAGRAAGVGQVVSDVSANSGRWLKFTAESAQRAQEHGLMKPKDGAKGVFHIMIGEPGKIGSWLQAETGPGALLTNPAVLSGISTMMAQQALQSQIQEIGAMVKRLDIKVDAIRRDQINELLSELDGVTEAIQRAQITRENSDGLVNDTLWSTVANATEKLGKVKNKAIRDIESLAIEAVGYKKIGEFADNTERIKDEAIQFLVVVAKCVALSDEVGIIELGRVEYTNPDELEKHQIGVLEGNGIFRAKTIADVGKAMESLCATSGLAFSHALLAKKSGKIITSVNHVGEALNEFQSTFGLEPSYSNLVALPWREAIKDPQQHLAAIKEVGPKVGKTALKAVAGIAGVAVVATTLAAGVKDFKDK